MFLGTYLHSLDEKNRLIIPAKLRDELKGTLYLTKGLENTLFLYSEKEWRILTKKLETLSFTKKDARNFMRIFYSNATTLELDKQGRITIPSYLEEYAFLEKECVILGVGDRIEIWSEEKYQEFKNTVEPTLSSISEHLFLEEDEVK